MDLNYQHLRYFWVAAREGSVTGAARRMRLSPSTVSSQIKQLEAWLGEPLFERRGRNLHLTVRGQVVAALDESMPEWVQESAWSLFWANLKEEHGLLSLWYVAQHC